ncbi:hypothetical protein RND81_08G201000 [Saponaria officinalis]|uniref:F-box domain-containing protein n=1 Tax=Saponaria officinalis TaxID=3572 RepID=A0AAW1JBD0_SAPOF
MAAYLPTEIIADILSRLPPKPLCRCKTVSKIWNSLINSQYLIKLHLSQTLKSNPILVICRNSLSVGKFFAGRLRFSAIDHPVKHLSVIPRVRLIGSCNGILCISDIFKKIVFFYNPCTKTRRLIPPIDGEHPLETLFNLSAHRLIDYIVVFGFGYDSGSDDYKLLRIIECYGEHERFYREVRVYSLRSNSWKIVEDKFDYYPHQRMNGVHINGLLYFALSDENGVPFATCLDLRTENFSVFDMFKYETSFDIRDFILLELKGCFAVMANYWKYDLDTQFGCADLWVMKENGKKESWVRLFRISDLPRIGSLTHIRPVFYSKDGGRILLELDGCKFGWFDWCSNMFERVEASGLLSKDSPFDTYTFVPSIVSLRTDEDHAKEKVVPKKNITKKNLDGFLSTGFKLRL